MNLRRQSLDSLGYCDSKVSLSSDAVGPSLSSRRNGRAARSLQRRRARLPTPHIPSLPPRRYDTLPMKTVSLFSGIGGLDLGLEEAGHEVILQVENDPHCVQVLQRQFPGKALARDVAEVRDLPEETELLAAGFPCPVSARASESPFPSHRPAVPARVVLVLVLVLVAKTYQPTENLRASASTARTSPRATFPARGYATARRRASCRTSSASSRGEESRGCCSKTSPDFLCGTTKTTRHSLPQSRTSQTSSNAWGTDGRNGSSASPGWGCRR